MALGKEIELQSGAVPSYWRLSEVVDCRKDKMLFLRVDGYKTAQHRLDGKPALVSEEHVFSDDAYPVEALNTSSAVVHGYVLLKALPKFEGATDV